MVLIAPQGNATPAGIEPRMRRFHVAGIFHSGMYEYDRGLALVQLQRCGADLSDGRSASPACAWRCSDRVRWRRAWCAIWRSRLGGGYYVSDWTRIHSNFFRSIEITKSMLFVILLLVVAVAAFNIVAALVMVVKEKRSDIAILRTLGAAPRNILAAFSIQGAFIGLAGTTAGAALGLVLAANLEALVHGLERLLGTHFLDAKVYFMSDLPAYARSGRCAAHLRAWPSRCARWRRCIRPGVPPARSRPRRCAMTDARPLSCCSARGVSPQLPRGREHARGAHRRGPGGGSAASGWRSSAPRARARPRCCRSWAASISPMPAWSKSAGRDIHALPERERGALRNRTIGFVYQFHHLLPEFSALENVAMPLLVRRERSRQRRRRARAICSTRVGPGRAAESPAAPTVRRRAPAHGRGARAGDFTGAGAGR